MGLSYRSPSLVSEQDTALKASPRGPRSGIPLAAESGVGITSGRRRGPAGWAGRRPVRRVSGKDHHNGEEARGWRQPEPVPGSRPEPGPSPWPPAGLVIGIVAFTAVVVGIGLGIGLMPIFLVGIPVLVGVIWLAGLGGRAERARFAVLLGAVIPAPAPLPDEPRGWRRMNLLFLARSTWLPTVYALIRLPLSAIQAVAVTAVWGVGLALIALPAYNGALPGGSAHLGSFALNNLAWVALGVATGVALVLAAPTLTRALAAEDAAVARWLLGPGRRARLTARIGELETSRAGVVGAAETERRRIERDLHDGAQQRLVSLAMELGRARAK